MTGRESQKPIGVRLKNRREPGGAPVRLAKKKIELPSGNVIRGT